MVKQMFPRPHDMKISKTTGALTQKMISLVGSAIMVRQDKLDTIQSHLEKIGYPERGDDIIVSYLLKKYTGCWMRTVPAKVLNLPEGEVGLNKDPKPFFDEMEGSRKI
jgi:hypothetical protein